MEEISRQKVNNNKPENPLDNETIEIFGAREHNLKNIDVTLPRNKLIVITGISGSGKSSLAFDTIYSEGQRRYMESFSAYARSFIGNLQRPDVDKINGLSPVISIEQKTTSKNPRSTVGTLTEIYDFLRLLFARASYAYSYLTGKKMVQLSEDQIVDHIAENFNQSKLVVLAPQVKARKGHYRELFQQIRKMGFLKVRVDGDIEDLVPKMQLDRYKTHDIEIVIDRIKVKKEDRYRISEAVKTALHHGKGLMMLEDMEGNIHHFSKHLMDPETGLSYEAPAPNTFSFNSPYGYCKECKGLGVVEEITRQDVMPDPSLSISRGGLVPLGEYRDVWIFNQLDALLKKHGFNISTPLHNLPEDLLQEILYGSGKSVAVKSSKINDGRAFSRFEGVIPYLEKQRYSGSEKLQKWIRQFTSSKICPVCNGERLKKEALYFKLGDKNISELANMNISRLMEWFDGVEEKLDNKQNKIAGEVLKELRKRLRFLLNVGLNYLSLDRPLKTLSGGEAQRIRLATQIGTQLVGVLYILDEPSIGLHHRDNAKLTNALKSLRDIGNTVIVVEHDRDMMLSADFILDVGPGAGRHGGHVVASGTPDEIKHADGLTAAYLREEKAIELPSARRPGNGNWLKISGASGHNLKEVNFKMPLGAMIGITGVSGSGKSTLIHETLFPLLSKQFFRAKADPLPYKGVEGVSNLDKVIEVDQSPIGRTPRSNPATYTGVFSEIRSLFASLPEAKIRGYKPGRFSFNVKGGRCETCEGGGMQLIEMEFLPDVHVLCPTCKGRRYNRETLEVRFKGKSISDVLEMTVEQAVEFFENQPRILRKIKTLQEVGLDYITLGQHATTLSGGEAQRVKLATELARKDTGNTLYILDEPTTGLHFQDIQHLLDVLNRLVDKGNTVLIIEHNMDVIKMTDFIVDLGPEGGEKGGYIIGEGSPEAIAEIEESYTGQFLKYELPSENIKSPISQ